jgi:hypothetical protein
VLLVSLTASPLEFKLIIILSVISENKVLSGESKCHIKPLCSPCPLPPALHGSSSPVTFAMTLQGQMIIKTDHAEKDKTNHFSLDTNCCQTEGRNINLNYIHFKIHHRLCDDLNLPAARQMR